MALPNLSARNAFFVNYTGTDDAGFNAIGSPWSYRTLQAALTALALVDNPPAPGNPWTIALGPGTFEIEGIELPPWVFIVGTSDGQGTQQTTLTIGEGGLTLGAGWAVEDLVFRGGFSDLILDVPGNLRLIFPATGIADRIFFFDKLTATVFNFSVEGSNNAHTVIFQDVKAPGVLDVFTGTVFLKNSEFRAGVTVQDAIAVNTALGLENSSLGRLDVVSFNAGSPLVTSDVSSWPVVALTTIVGAPSIFLTNDATALGYTPTDSGDWVPDVPTTVQQALDYLAAAAGGGGIPALTGNENKLLVVNPTATAAEWANALKDAAGIASIDTFERKFYDSAGNPTGDWANGFLYDAAAESAANWFTRQLLDSVSAVSINWATREGYDAAGIPSFFWETRATYDATGLVSINWANRALLDSLGAVSVDWEGRQAFDSAAALSLVWENRTAYDAAGLSSIDWAARSLLDNIGQPSANWFSRFLNDSDNATSINWESRTLFYPAGTTAFNFDAGTINSTAGAVVVNLATLALIFNTLTASAATNLTLAAGAGNQNVVLSPTGTGFVSTAANLKLGAAVLGTITGATYAINVKAPVAGAAFLQLDGFAGTSKLGLSSGVDAAGGALITYGSTAFLSFGTVTGDGNTGLTARARFTSTGNLLIGTTTDATGSGGLRLNGNAFVALLNYNSGGNKRTTAVFNATANTTLANVTSLSVACLTTQSYKFRAVLQVTADAAGGYKAAAAYSSTTSAIQFQITAINNTGVSLAVASRQTASGGNAGAVGGTDIQITIEGTFVTTGAGNLTIQFAQNVASGVSTVLIGSFMEVEGF